MREKIFVYQCVVHTYCKSCVGFAPCVVKFNLGTVQCSVVRSGKCRKAIYMYSQNGTERIWDFSSESPHKNRACHGWSECNGICMSGFYLHMRVSGSDLTFFFLINLLKIKSSQNSVGPMLIVNMAKFPVLENQY